VASNAELNKSTMEFVFKQVRSSIISFRSEISNDGLLRQEK
jgi:hypothetical protein